MAYRVKKKESVSKAVRRLGRNCIEDALGGLKKGNRAEAIHCVRKEIKKVRAVLRLVRTGLAKKDFRRQVKLLRQAAAHLAAARDAFVKVQTLRNLAAHFQGQLSPGAMRHVRAELRKDLDQEMKRFAKEKTTALQTLFRREIKTLKRLDVRGKGWEALGPGVKTAYRQSRRAYQQAATAPSPGNFHLWRKRAKTLWYQVRLLQPLWPEQMNAMASELGSLEASLGNDHDLAVLRQDLEDRRIGKAFPRELEALDGLIGQRQSELRSAALAMGARFFAEKPVTFSERLGGFWVAWRRETKPHTPSAQAAVS